MQLLSSLTHRPFALLWSGQTISRVGDQLYGIALAWWILEKTGSAKVQGTVFIFSMTPMLLFLLLGGVVVDRFARSRVMLASDLLRGVLASAIALLVFFNRLEVWHLLIAAMIFGFVSAFFRPAYMAVVPEITPPDKLPSANSLTSMSAQLIGILGPSLGAFLVALGGTALAFALDGLSFFVGAACLVPILPLSVSRATARQSSIGQDLREGIRTVLASAWLWIGIVVFAFVNMAQVAPFVVAMPFLIKDNLHADVGALGLIYSSLSLGSVLGAVWLGRYRQLRHRGWIAYGAVLVGAVAMLSVGLSIGLIGILGAIFTRGVTASLFSLVWINTLQELVPREKLGRVASIDDLGSFVLLPVGYALSGWATDLVGAPSVFVIGGGLSLVVGALALLHPAIRHLD